MSDSTRADVATSPTSEAATSPPAASPAVARQKTAVTPATETPAPTGRRALAARVSAMSILWILFILVGLVIAFTIVQPNFIQPFNIRSLFADNSTLILLSIGMTFVIITAGIDLSVGSVLIFSGVVAAKVMLAIGSTNATVGAAQAGWGVILIGVLAGIAAGLAWGVVNGLLVAKANIPPLIVTLGTLGMALGASYLLTGGTDVRGLPSKFTSTIGFGLLFGQVPYLVIIAAVVAVVLGLVLAFTRFGRYTYAVGSNAEGARRVGINVDRHLIKVYALMGALSGLAGCLSLAHFTTTTISGHTADNLGAIAAVVLGGTSLFGGVGTIAGTVIGVLIPAVLQSGFVTVGVNPYWQYVAVGIVLVGAVYLDQLRRRARDRH